MELSTQCPRCGTVFPATLEQLQLRKGYIRCVNCAHIFDGYEAVVANEPATDAAAAAPAPPAPAAPRPSPAPVPGPAPVPEPAPVPGPAPLPEPTPVPEPAPDFGPAPDSEAPPSMSGEGPAPDPAWVSGPQPVSEDWPSEPVRSWSTMRPAAATTSAAAASTAAGPKPAAAPAPQQPPAPEPAPAAAMPSVLRQRSVARPGAAQPEPAAAPDSGFRVPIPDEDDFSDGPHFTLSSARLPPRHRPEPSLGVGEAVADPEMDIPDAGKHGAGGRDEFAEDRPAVYVDPGREQQDRPSVYIEPRRDEQAESLPEFLETRDRRWRGVLRVFWGVLSLLGLAVLLAQFVYVYRGQIADHSPDLRPMLQQACVSLKCDVPYARRILLIAITNSSLRALPAGNAHGGSKSASGGNDSSRMLLQLTLRNNDERAQEWPTLTLDLVDFSGAVVSKKNLSPAEYLPPGVRSASFAAHSEVSLAIPLTVTGYHVNGYQLGKFFP